MSNPLAIPGDPPVEQQLAEMRAEIEALRAEVKRGAAPAALSLGDNGEPLSLGQLHAAVDERAKMVAASFTECPPNFHQAMVYMTLTKPDVPTSTKLAFAAASLAIVALQVLVGRAMALAALTQSCIHNSQCGMERFCRTEPDGSIGICKNCAEAYVVEDGDPVWMRGLSISHPHLTRHNLTNTTVGDFVCPRDDTICLACYDPGTASWPVEQAIVTHVKSIAFLDFMAILLTAIIAATAIAAELRDAKICGFAARLNDIFSPTFFAQERTVCYWQLFSQLIYFLRRFIIVPCMMSTIPQVILWRGSDALSVALNIISVLFLLEVDNIVYEYGLPQKVRSEVELRGRVSLDADTQNKWNRVNSMWICVNAIFFPLAVLLVKVTETHGALPASLIVYFLLNQSAERVAENRPTRDVLFGLV
eukprot:COSAG03_NODE_2662_length_2536_cov_1.940792_2_plen_419_part_01